MLHSVFNTGSSVWSLTNRRWWWSSRVRRRCATSSRALYRTRCGRRLARYRWERPARLLVWLHVLLVAQVGWYPRPTGLLLGVTCLPVCLWQRSTSPSSNSKQGCSLRSIATNCAAKLLFPTYKVALNRCIVQNGGCIPNSIHLCLMCGKLVVKLGHKSAYNDATHEIFGDLSLRTQDINPIKELSSRLLFPLAHVRQFKPHLAIASAIFAGQIVQQIRPVCCITLCDIS